MQLFCYEEVITMMINKLTAYLFGSAYTKSKIPAREFWGNQIKNEDLRKRESRSPGVSISPIAFKPLKPLSDQFGRVKKSSEIVTFSVGLGGKEMGGDQQLDKGEQNQCSHKQKGRTKRKNPLQHCCCLRLFGGDDTVGDQGAPHKGRLHYFHCSWNNSFLIAIPE